MSDPVQMIRSNLARMEAYKPIHPFEVLASRLGKEEGSLIKLDANENPYGLLPAVRRALADLRYPHIYPDPESQALRQALAAHTGVPAEQIMAGAGSDELIDLIMRLFLEPRDTILTCPPTFGMYAFDAAINGARAIAIPRRPDFSLDLKAIEQAMETERPKLVFLASPNNPDGSVLPEEEFQRLLGLPSVLVLDEAYAEFAGLSRIQEVLSSNRLIVLRTFSKWGGLAGLRIGYGAFPPGLMPYLWKIKQPYNVSVAASAAALAALGNLNELNDQRDRIVHERQRMVSAFERIEFLAPYPSQANFVLCRVVGRSARQLTDDLAQEGILIRYFDSPGLRDHIRISVGRPEHTDALLAALGRLE